MMNDEERQALIDEDLLVKHLIWWHTEHKESIWDNPKDYEDYINAALDRIIEIRNILKEDSQEQDLS